MLEKWIHKGIVDDACCEFMIEEDTSGEIRLPRPCLFVALRTLGAVPSPVDPCHCPDAHGDSVTVEMTFNDAYWEKHYTVVHERVPVFLSDVRPSPLSYFAPPHMLWPCAVSCRHKWQQHRANPVPRLSYN